MFPALLALELMERGQKDAEPLVRTQLQASPPSVANGTAVALTYARILLDLQRNAEARALLERLTQAQPDLPEPWLLLASLQVQDSTAHTAATASLQKYMGLARQSGDERSARGLTQAYLLMAQVAEKQKDFVAANAWLDRIENADEIMAAQMRRASLLARQGQMAQARALLRNQPERRPEDARLKLVAEAQLLRDFKDWQQAYEVYGEAVTRFPNDNDLIYDQAMMAEKANRLDAMENLLRQLIATKPDHHHAYNALGYSLADRSVRLPEAKQLIEKAVELAPEDAYIQDSLGWVEFRMGNLDVALRVLQGAALLETVTSAAREAGVQVHALSSGRSREGIDPIGSGVEGVIPAHLVGLALGVVGDLLLGGLDGGDKAPAGHQSASSRAAVGQPSAGRPRRTCSFCTAARVPAPRMPSTWPTSWPRAERRSCRAFIASRSRASSGVPAR